MAHYAPVFFLSFAFSLTTIGLT